MEFLILYEQFLIVFNYANFEVTFIIYYMEFDKFIGTASFWANSKYFFNQNCSLDLLPLIHILIFETQPILFSLFDINCQAKIMKKLAQLMLETIVTIWFWSSQPHKHKYGWMLENRTKFVRMVRHLPI